MDADVRRQARELLAKYNITGPMTMADADRIIANVGLFIPPEVLQGLSEVDQLYAKVHLIGHCMMGHEACYHFGGPDGLPILRLQPKSELH